MDVETLHRAHTADTTVRTDAMQLGPRTSISKSAVITDEDVYERLWDATGQSGQHGTIDC